MDACDSDNGSEGSDVGVCNSARSPCNSLSEGVTFRHSTRHADGIVRSPIFRTSPEPRRGPLTLKLRWAHHTFDVTLDVFESVVGFREHIQELTKVPADRQTLILAGRR